MLGFGLGFGRRQIGGGTVPFVGSLDEWEGQLYAVTGPNRAFSSYTGPCWRVRKASDGAETDIGFDAQGWADATALLSFADGGSLTVAVDYDKTGNNRYIINSSGSNQPRCVLNGVVDVGPNGHACAHYDGVDDNLAMVNSVDFLNNVASFTSATIVSSTGSSSSTIVAVARADITSVRAWLNCPSSTQVAAALKTVDAGTLYTTTQTISAAAWLRLIQRGLASAGSVELICNGTPSSTAVSPAQAMPNTDSTVGVRIGCHPNASSFFTGYIGQVVLAQSALSAVELNASLALMAP